MADIKLVGVAELDKALKKRVNMEAVKTVVRKNGDQLTKP